MPKGNKKWKPSKFKYEEWQIKYGLNPNATPKEKAKWWAQEMEYWVTGRLNLVGPHYFALTQCMAKDAWGRTTRIIWRDVDEEIYGAYMKAKENFWDLLILKRREIGLTLTFGGVIPIWSALTSPGSTFLLTSADKPRLANMFDEKTKFIYKNLDPEFRPEIVHQRQDGYMHMGKEVEKGIIHGLDSKIIAKETVDQPKAFEAYRAKGIFIDEFFLHPKADQVLRSGQASVKAGFVKVGPIVLGGSAGESSVEGQKKGMELWDAAEVLNIVTLFIPGTKGIMFAPELDDNGREIPGKILNFCKNGHSDVKAAEEWIMRTREKLDRLDDKSYLESFIKQYPLTLQEIFQANAKGALPKHVVQKLNDRERILITSKPAIERGYFIKNQNDEIEFVPDGNGKWRVLQRPIPGHTYIAGIDPIPFNSSNMGDGSKQACAIKDRDLNRYVAWMEDRDEDSSAIVNQIILGLRAYNDAKAMLEVNRGGVTKKEFKDSGFYHLLAEKPVLLGKGFTSGEGSKGYYKTDKTSELGNSYLIKYLNTASDEIYFPDIISQAKNFLVENTDLLDAVIACEIYEHQLSERYKKVNPNAQQQVKQVRELVFENGRWITKWREIRV